MLRWLVGRKVVVREGALQRLCDTLFPEPVEKTEDGLTYLTDSSVDANLQAALVDLEEGVNDEVTRSTLRAVLHRLHEARDLLHAEYRIKKEASYLVVDSPQTKPIEERVSSLRS